MVSGKVFIYAKPFKGFPEESDFRLEEVDLRPITDGEFLVRAEYLSVDPYMRAYAKNVPLGSPYIGSQVAKIIESKNPKFPVGKYVVGTFGWTTHTIADGSPDPARNRAPYLLPDFGDLSPSLGIGILGMPGNSAYFGLLEIIKPKPGETLVVSGAAGAVGSVVGQIGKIHGCKVIGIAGSIDKGVWLTSELGFDHFINYKTSDVATRLKKVAPHGVDCYFDNVGGAITSAVIANMNSFGRIAICGSISTYNDVEGTLKSGINEATLVGKQIKIEGFLVNRYLDRWMEGINQLLQWVQQGKLKYQETVTEGFENMPKAFIDMLNGGNTGKAVVKV